MLVARDTVRFVNTGANNEYALPFDISYTPDFWHRIRNTINVQAYTAQANAADVATALLSTQTALATDYFELRATDMQKKILVDTMDNYRRNVDLTNTLYKTGINSEQDLVQAQNQLDTATAQATDLGVARAQYEHAIAILIGKPPSEATIAVGTFNPNPPKFRWHCLRPCSNEGRTSLLLNVRLLQQTPKLALLARLTIRP